VYFLGGKDGRCVRLTTLPPSCAVVMKSGSLNFLESSGPLQACNRTALSFYLFYIDMVHYIHRMMLYVRGLFVLNLLIAGFGSWRDNIVWCGRIRVISHSRSDGSSASPTLLFDRCPSHRTADTGNRGKHVPSQCVRAHGGIGNAHRIIVRRPEGKK